MQLTDPKTIKDVLSKNGFHFKKSLGQNFLINPSVCPKMADSAIANGEDAVIEIGPGIGVLTAELAKRAESVLCIEIDERLRPVLNETLAEYENVEIVFGDCMKIDIAKLIEEKFRGKRVSVCANLPYYITSPIIMMLLESCLDITSITVMVQKEAAERICAKVGSRESGAVTVAVNYYSQPEILFKVGSGSFMPPPNVDSSVIRLAIRPNPPIAVGDEKKFFSFVRSAFGQRRKTLVNSVSAAGIWSKAEVVSALQKADLKAETRAEAMSLEKLAAVFNALS